MKDDMMKEIEQYEREAGTARAEIRQADLMESVQPNPQAQTPQPAQQQTAQNNGVTVISGFLSILVLFVFIGGLIGAIAFSAIEPRASVICVGAIFFTIGLAATLSQKITLDNWPVLIFPVVGAAMMIIPGLMLYSDKHEGFHFEISERFGANCALGVFVLVGLCLIFLPGKIREAKLKIFSDSVMATCTELDSQTTYHNGHRHKVYLPTWKYEYRGQSYVSTEGTYTRIGVPTIGEVHRILIDPNNPDRIYRPVDDPTKLILIMGLLFTGLGAAGIVMYNFGEIAGMNMMFVFFMLIGFGMMIVPKKTHEAKMKKYSDSVIATCVHLSTSHSSGANNLYAPTWEYTYNGVSYTHKETTYSNTGVPKVGDMQRLMIDPNAPQKIYRPVASHRRTFFLIGLMIFLIGVLSMISNNFLQ